MQRQRRCAALPVTNFYAIHRKRVDRLSAVSKPAASLTRDRVHGYGSWRTGCEYHSWKSRVLPWALRCPSSSSAFGTKRRVDGFRIRIFLPRSGLNPHPIAGNTYENGLISKMENFPQLIRFHTFRLLLDSKRVFDRFNPLSKNFFRSSSFISNFSPTCICILINHMKTHGSKMHTSSQ